MGAALVRRRGHVAVVGRGGAWLRFTERRSGGSWSVAHRLLFLRAAVLGLVAMGMMVWLPEGHHALDAPVATQAPAGGSRGASARAGRESAAQGGGQALLLPLIQKNARLKLFGPEWPQVQANPQHTGFTPERLGNTFRVAWTHPFQPERVHPQTQAIVYQDTVFVGTEMGRLYALQARSGALLWVFEAGGPILNSVAADADKVVFGSLDGAVYAVAVATGRQVWKAQLSTRLGFSTAPVIADDRVLLGGQNGVFYALDLPTGAVLWQYQVGAPILQTAAWNNGQVYFGAMDMRVYALRASDGSLVWRSPRLNGMAFKDYWPVVYQGKVIVRPMGFGGIELGFPFLWFSTDAHWQWLMQYGPTIAAGHLPDVPDAMAAQDAGMADVATHPDKYTQNLIILDETSGQIAFQVPHWTVQTMNGAPAPPCVDRDGLLITPVMFIRSGWGRLDLATQRVIDLLYEHVDRRGGPLAPQGEPPGMGNRDENLNVTCAANQVLAMHTEEGNANYTGAFDLESRTWLPIRPGHTNRQMSTNSQGGGGNPASVSGAMIFHISWHELIARTSD